MTRRLRASSIAFVFATVSACLGGDDRDPGEDEHDVAFPSSMLDRTLPDVDAIHYAIELKVEDAKEQETFVAEVRGTFVATRAITELTLDFEGNEVDEVEVAASPARYRRDGATLVIELPARVETGQTFATRIRYHGALMQTDRADPDDFAAFGGLMVKQRNPDGRRIFTSLDWPRKARRWLPLRDHPRDAAMVTITATFPAAFVVLANGKREGVDENADGTRTWHYDARTPMPTYDFHVSAYDDWKLRETASTSRVPIATYTYGGAQAVAPGIYDDVAKVLDFYESTFGRYRWGSLTFIEEPIFGGGMENASVVSMDETLFADPEGSDARKTAFHELGHHWSGNLVRYRTWNDFWLSEGFTEYLTARAVGAVDGPAAEREVYLGYLSETLGADRENPHPVRPPGRDEVDVLSIFDAIPYQKGALVLRMIEGMIGREAMTAFLRSWFDKHAFQAVTTADLERELTEATGRDLRRFFETFVYSGYHPELRVTLETDADGPFIRVEQLQAQGPESGFVFPLVVEVTDAGGAAERLTIDVDARTTTVRLARPATAIKPDPDGYVLGTFTCGRSGGSCNEGYRCIAYAAESLCVPR
jgi:aminopeptidase N